MGNTTDVRYETWNQDKVLDLIQFSIEEGTGDPCSREDAISILIDWQNA